MGGTDHDTMAQMEHGLRVEGLSGWVSDQKLPLVSRVTLSSLRYVARNGRLLCVAVASTDDELNKYEEGLRTIARLQTSPLGKDVQMQYYFGVLDSREENVDKFLLHYTVDLQALPQILVF